MSLSEPGSLKPPTKTSETVTAAQSLHPFMYPFKQHATKYQSRYCSSAFMYPAYCMKDAKKHKTCYTRRPPRKGRQTRADKLSVEVAPSNSQNFQLGSKISISPPSKKKTMTPSIPTVESININSLLVESINIYRVYEVLIEFLPLYIERSKSRPPCKPNPPLRNNRRCIQIFLPKSITTLKSATNYSYTIYRAPGRQATPNSRNCNNCDEGDKCCTSQVSHRFHRPRHTPNTSRLT